MPERQALFSVRTASGVSIDCMTSHTPNALSRRTLIAVGGTGVVVGQSAKANASDATGVSTQGGSTTAVETPLALDNIQGNILGGFNKDHQRFLFFRLGRAASARQWLADLVDEVATGAEVASFNRLFKKARARRGDEAQAPTSQWLNVAFT